MDDCQAWRGGAKTGATAGRRWTCSSAECMVLVPMLAHGGPARAAVPTYLLAVLFWENMFGGVGGTAEWLPRAVWRGISLRCLSCCPTAVLLASSLVGCMPFGRPECCMALCCRGTCSALQSCIPVTGRSPFVAGRGTLTGCTSLPVHTAQAATCLGLLTCGC